MISIYSTSVVLWFAEKLDASRFLTQPEALDWVFQPLRLLAILFFVLFTFLATRQAGGKACWRRYATCALIVYVGLAVGMIVVVCSGVFCFMVTDTPEKTVFAAKYGLVLWILELLLWWSLILIAFGIGFFRSRSAIRKDHNSCPTIG